MEPMAGHDKQHPADYDNMPYIANLGKPSDRDDANMVDEGAMTSIQYYNRLIEEDLKMEETYQ